MKIAKILCKQTGKVLNADQIFKVKNEEEGCVEEIVSYCSSCPYSETKKEAGLACRNCYGAIAQSRKKIKQRIGGHKVKIENYRNTFLQDEFGQFIRSMDADDFMNFIDKLANLKSNGWGELKGFKQGLGYGDKPSTWKTICLSCRTECNKNGTKPICKQAGEYLEDKFGVSVASMNKEQLLSELPANLICQKDYQRIETL